MGLRGSCPHHTLPAATPCPTPASWNQTLPTKAWLLREQQRCRPPAPSSQPRPPPCSPASESEPGRPQGPKALHLGLLPPPARRPSSALHPGPTPTPHILKKDPPKARRLGLREAECRLPRAPRCPRCPPWALRDQKHQRCPPPPQAQGQPQQPCAACPLRWGLSPLHG